MSETKPRVDGVSEHLSSPNQTEIPPCTVCGERLMMYWSGPLPGCPQGISAYACRADKEHTWKTIEVQSQSLSVGENHEW